MLLPVLGFGQSCCLLDARPAPCKGEKDASGVDVCPVHCIHSADAADMAVIDPDECIDCGACESVCPVNAIYYEEDTPEEWKDYLAINANYFKK